AVTSQDGVHLKGVLMNITEQKRAQEELASHAAELHRSREELQRHTAILKSVLHSMGDGVVVADRNGSFLVFNPAAQRILGRGLFEGRSEEWSDYFGVFLPDQTTPYPNDQLPLIRALRGESVDSAEIFIRHVELPDGAWVSVNASPLQEDSGVSGGVAVLRDITEAKRAAEALTLAKNEAEQANHAKSEFLSRMSHELRTPMNSILGFAQLLELENLAPEQKDNLQHILRAGSHLLELINEVLDLSRIEAGKLGLSPEPVRMREALKDALELVRPLAERQNIHISPDVAIRCDRHVLADRQRLKQVLLNLLANAIKFNREGGSVMLACDEIDGNRLRIEVTDTGRGIAAEDISRIFVPFERLWAEQEGIDGTGLGLALSKRLIEAMGGRIGVESTPGAGSRFYVELSLTEHAIDSLPASGAPFRSGNDEETYRGTVLYIEDNLSNLRLIERVLARYPGVRLLAAMQARLG